MAKRKRKAAASSSPRVSAEEKITRLLGLLLVKEIKKASDQVALLRRAGFEVSDVADMLNMTANNVRVADHHARKKKVG